MGQPEDDDVLSETDTGREYVSMTRVYPGQWDTYVFLKRTERLIGERKRAGYVNYAVERLELIEEFRSLGSLYVEPIEPERVIWRYRAKIPESEAGFSTDVPADRVHEDIARSEEGLFANFEPACFALICDGGIMYYALDARQQAYPTIHEDILWAAQRAVDRGEAECPAITDYAITTRELEDRLLRRPPLRSGRGYARRQPEEFSLALVERYRGHGRPRYLSPAGDDDEFSLDLGQPVSPGAMMAAILEASRHSWGVGGWAGMSDELEESKAMLRDVTEMLAAEGSFVAGPELAARGIIPTDKLALYEHACRKAEYLGVYIISELLVEVSAVEMGISDKTPAEQEEIVAAWVEQVDTIRASAASIGRGLTSFPGRRPWTMTAAQAMGLETGIFPGDIVDEASLPELIADLADHDASVRAEAARNMMRLSIAAAPASNALIAALDDEDITVRLYAAWALQRIGTRAPIPAATGRALARVLVEAPSSEDRLAAARALGQVKHVDDYVIECIISAFDDEDSDVAFEAMSDVITMRLPVSRVTAAVLAVARGENGRVAGRALWAIGYFPEEDITQPVIDTLLELLHSGDRQVRHGAMYALAQSCPDHAAIVPEAIAMIESDEYRYAGAAIYALSAAAPRAAEAVPLLVEVLAAEPMRATGAGGVLRKIGVGAEYVPALMGLLDSEDAATQQGAMLALSGATIPDKSLIAEAIVAMVDSDDRRVSGMATSRLADLGLDAACVLPALRELAEGASDDVLLRQINYAIDQISASVARQQADSEE